MFEGTIYGVDSKDLVLMDAGRVVFHAGVACWDQRLEPSRSSASFEIFRRNCHVMPGMYSFECCLEIDEKNDSMGMRW